MNSNTFNDIHNSAIQRQKAEINSLGKLLISILGGSVLPQIVLDYKGPTSYTFESNTIVFRMPFFAFLL